jgi:hemoglobin
MKEAHLPARGGFHGARMTVTGPTLASPHDLASRDDVVRLVDAFYDRVRADALLDPIFDGVAHVDWAVHLPKMYAFWESVLFGATGYKGNPLAVHRALARQTPEGPAAARGSEGVLTAHEFARWLELFHASVDELFAGPIAEEAKGRASRIAVVMQHHIAADRLAAVPDLRAELIRPA